MPSSAWVSVTAEIDGPGPPIISSGSHEMGSAKTPLKTNIAGIHQAQDHRKAMKT
jgi:hypothetical protein